MVEASAITPHTTYIANPKVRSARSSADGGSLSVRATPVVPSNVRTRDEPRRNEEKASITIGIDTRTLGISTHSHWLKASSPWIWYRMSGLQVNRNVTPRNRDGNESNGNLWTITSEAIVRAQNKVVTSADVRRSAMGSGSRWITSQKRYRVGGVHKRTTAIRLSSRDRRSLIPIVRARIDHLDRRSCRRHGDLDAERNGIDIRGRPRPAHTTGGVVIEVVRGCPLGRGGVPVRDRARRSVVRGHGLGGPMVDSHVERVPGRGQGGRCDLDARRADGWARRLRRPRNDRVRRIDTPRELIQDALAGTRVGCRRVVDRERTRAGNAPPVDQGQASVAVVRRDAAVDGPGPGKSRDRGDGGGSTAGVHRRRPQEHDRGRGTDGRGGPRGRRGRSAAAGAEGGPHEGRWLTGGDREAR